MEVMGGDQRSSDCTGRRKLLGGEIYGNKRRRTTTAMQNFLTFKRIKTAASEVESARRGYSLHGLTRGRWQPLVRDSKFGQRQQLLQSRGSRRRTIEDEQSLRRRRLLQRLQLLDGQRQRLGGGNRSTEFFVPRTHSTDLEVATRQDQHRDFVDELLEPIWGRRRGP